MNTETVVLGTGCFWCTEAIFKLTKGIVKTEVGYAGGITPNPDYDSVCSGVTGHAEVTKIIYDPVFISFEELLNLFWRSHDPTSLNRQGHDVGTEYRSIILYTTENQRFIAEKQKLKIDGAVTEIKKLDKFYPAEEDHQNYFNKNPESAYCQWVIKPKITSLFP